nr:hypothetical protein [Hepelivirales sp.]
MSSVDITPQNGQSSDFDLLQQNDEVVMPVTKSQVKSQTAGFISKCLHPPSSVASYNGLPTSDARGATICVERKTLKLMNQPYYLPTITDPNPKVKAVTASQLGAFKLVRICPNGQRINNIQFIQVDGSWYQDLNNLDVVTTYDFKNFKDDAMLSRIDYKSNTITLNATMFNNVGFCVESQFNPNIVFQENFLSLCRNHPEYAYKIAKLKAARASRDTVKISDWSNFDAHHIKEIERRTGRTMDDLRIDPRVGIQIIELGKIDFSNGSEQFDFSQILNLSSKSYTGPARDGSFSVQRLNTVNPKWCTAGSSNALTFVNGQYECYYSYTLPDGASSLNQLFENQAIDTPVNAIKPAFDTLWTSDMTFTICMYDGLALNPEAPTSFQLLATKTIIGSEIQPALKSPWTGLQRPGPPPDIMAMNQLMDVFYEMKDSMPAKYNFLGGILGLLGKGVAAIGKSNILGTIGGLANRAQRAIGNDDTQMELEQEGMNKQQKVASNKKAIKKINDKMNAEQVGTKKEGNRIKELEKRIAKLSMKTKSTKTKPKVSKKSKKPSK